MLKTMYDAKTLIYSSEFEWFKNEREDLQNDARTRRLLICRNADLFAKNN